MSPEGVLAAWESVLRSLRSRCGGADSYLGQDEEEAVALVDAYLRAEIEHPPDHEEDR